MEAANLLLALIGFVCGCAISGLKYLLTHKKETQSVQGLMYTSLIRQFCNVSALILAWLIARKLGLAQIPLLVGLALGLTLPTIALAFLAKRRLQER